MNDAFLALAEARSHNPVHDFDYLMGAWTVHNRRLRERLKGCTDWQEFDGRCLTRPLLGGLANEEEFRTEFWPGFIGMSFRFFDPRTRQWAIHWADSRHGHLEPPVFGGFSDDRGLFEGEDVLDGRAIRVRFLWSRINTPTPRWEQAFSPDGGRSWETNWVMDFARA